MGGEAQAGIDPLAGRVDRAAQHDEGVREIIAAELARIESDLDRGGGRRLEHSRSRGRRAAAAGASARTAASTARARPSPGCLGRRASAVSRRRRSAAASSNNPKSTNGAAQSWPPKPIHPSTQFSRTWWRPNNRLAPADQAGVRGRAAIELAGARPISRPPPAGSHPQRPCLSKPCSISSPRCSRAPTPCRTACASMRSATFTAGSTCSTAARHDRGRRPRARAARRPQIIFLGDLIDRGPDSRGVVERLMRAQRRSRGRSAS